MSTTQTQTLTTLDEDAYSWKKSVSGNGVEYELGSPKNTNLAAAGVMMRASPCNRLIWCQ